MIFVGGISFDRLGGIFVFGAIFVFGVGRSCTMTPVLSDGVLFSFVIDSLIYKKKHDVSLFKHNAYTNIKFLWLGRIQPLIRMLVYASKRPSLVYLHNNNVYDFSFISLSISSSSVS